MESVAHNSAAESLHQDPNSGLIILDPTLLFPYCPPSVTGLLPEIWLNTSTWINLTQNNQWVVQKFFPRNRRSDFSVYQGLTVEKSNSLQNSLAGFFIEYCCYLVIARLVKFQPRNHVPDLIFKVCSMLYKSPTHGKVFGNICVINLVLPATLPDLLL